MRSSPGKKKAPFNNGVNVALQLNHGENRKGPFQKEDLTLLLNIPGVSVTSTPRKDGRFQGYVKLKDVKYYVYGKSQEDVLIKIQRLIKYGAPKKKDVSNVPTTFNAFAQYYFENFRVKKVTAQTFRADLSRYNCHVKPYFKEKPLKKINALECQKLIEGLSIQGKGKTSEEVYSLLSLIFKTAIKHNLIKNNPLDIIYRAPYEQEHGKTLSPEDVKRFKALIKGDKFEKIFLLALYTGLRPNEYQKIEVSGPFIIAVNSKRKNGKIEYKKIPVMRGLAPYVNGIIDIAPYEQVRKRFKALMPDFTLKDLRKTFNSRCIECGINDVVRKLWMGHSLGALGQAYTELSEDFFLSEGKKFFYDGD